MSTPPPVGDNNNNLAGDNNLVSSRMEETIGYGRTSSFLADADADADADAKGEFSAEMKQHFSDTQQLPLAGFADPSVKLSQYRALVRLILDGDAMACLRLDGDRDACKYALQAGLIEPVLMLSQRQETLQRVAAAKVLAQFADRSYEGGEERIEAMKQAGAVDALSALLGDASASVYAGVALANLASESGSKTSPSTTTTTSEMAPAVHFPPGGERDAHLRKRPLPTSEVQVVVAHLPENFLKPQVHRRHHNSHKGTVSYLIKKMRRHKATASGVLDAATLEVRSRYSDCTRVVRALGWCIMLAAYFAYLTAQLDIRETNYGNLATERFLFAKLPRATSRLQDAITWLHDAFVEPSWRDPTCGDGVCEPPYEVPGHGPNGCTADCGVDRQAVGALVRVSSDFRHPRVASDTLRQPASQGNLYREMASGSLSGHHSLIYGVQQIPRL
ncbi:hypothetical protein PPROV_000270200 [Pycnococcus provasolii]|uniref:Uncharacterized protein n=1 Tax=Pycnococcus provasolii TaxID=41880 RepID=A0A830HB42_9CHLO|nr:hypothetical protein PPROV_000270200 [Pycnococcus provasolii]